AATLLRYARITGDTVALAAGEKASRHAKVFHEPQRFFPSRECDGVTGNARVAKQCRRAVRAGAEDGIAGLAQTGLLFVARFVTPAAVGLLRLNEAFDLRFERCHRLRQMTAKKRKYPLHDVAVGL